MRLKILGNKADKIAISVKNLSSSVTIPIGSPVFFVMNGTEDGLAVQNAEDAGADADQTFFAGILATALPPLTSGQSIVYGMANARVLTTGTAIAKGDVFTIVTTAAANQITRSGAGAVLTVATPGIVAAEANATATGNSITLKVFVRAMG